MQGLCLTFFQNCSVFFFFLSFSFYHFLPNGGARALLMNNMWVWCLSVHLWRSVSHVTNKFRLKNDVHVWDPALTHLKITGCTPAVERIRHWPTPPWMELSCQEAGRVLVGSGRFWRSVSEGDWDELITKEGLGMSASLAGTTWQKTCGMPGSVSPETRVCLFDFEIFGRCDCCPRACGW